MPLLIELRQRVAAYLAGEASLPMFEQWFMPIAATVDTETDPPTGDLVTQIELWLSEYLSGHRTEEELRALMTPLVERYTERYVTRTYSTVSTAGSSTVRSFVTINSLRSSGKPREVVLA